MQLYYIRHAQSINNALWDATGSDDNRSEDPELTPLGLQQAQLVAEHLATGMPRGGQRTDGMPGGFGITHLYCSLMVRTVQTGAVISTRLGLPLIGWAELHEEGGVFLEDKQTQVRVGMPGKPRAYFRQYFPMLQLPACVREDGWYNRPFEEREERPERARRVVAELLARHRNTADRVAVISHGGFYNHFVKELIGLPGVRGFWFLMNNTAISRFDFFEEHFDLTYHNRTDHLPGDLIT